MRYFNFFKKAVVDGHWRKTLIIGQVFPSNAGDQCALAYKANLPAGAEMLTQLARRNALEISDSRWDYDVTRLAEALGRVTPRGGGTRPPGSR